MGRVIVFLIAAAVFGSSVFAQRIPIKNVAIIETQIDERSGAADEINRAEVSVITGEIRQEAVNNLPRSRFNVMTSETVMAMGDAIMEECAEENCVIALGSKIGADYIVRGTISKFRQNFTLAVEIYETDYGMLVTTASVRTANLDELLEKTIEASAQMYKRFLEIAGSRAPAQAAAAPAAPTPPPVLYTFEVSASPAAGGRVTHTPNQTHYAPGTTVTVTAATAPGYRFTGWSGALTSSNSRETVAVNSNMTLTANFVRTYVLTTNIAPPRGGTVSRSPDRVRYEDGTQVALTAIPARGYRFTGWSGAATSNDSVLTATMGRDLSVTANFTARREERGGVQLRAAGHGNAAESKPEPPPPRERTLDDAMADGRRRVAPKPEEPKEPKKSSPLKLTMRISAAALAAGGFIGGSVYEGKAKSEHGIYKDSDRLHEMQEAKRNAKNFESTGNAFYTLGWIGLSGFTLTLFF